MKKLLLAAGIGLALLTAFSLPMYIAVADVIGTPSVSSGSSGQVINPLGGINSFCGLIKALLQAAVAIGIPIAVLFIVYAGLKFVLARGNSDRLTEARRNMLWTVVGIGIFLSAWLLAMVIVNTVNTISGQQVISCN